MAAFAPTALGQAVAPPFVEDAGPAVTFSHDIAPIVFARCASCHRPGEAAPFSLLTYEDVRHRASQIVEVTCKRFMPPWLPSEGAEQFSGARRLTEKELSTLSRWVEQGCKEGNPKETPPAPAFTDGWQTGVPDLVLESPAYTLPPDGQDAFRNFVVPIKLDSPRWIRSIELRPENPRVTHHARLGVDSSTESIRRDAEDPEPGYAGMAWGQDPDGQLVIWAPGMVADPGSPGVAWRLYPETCLVLHTHMQPSGKPEVVRFRIGIHFADRAPTTHPAMLRIGSCDIDIPAGAARHVVTDTYTLPVDVDVQTVFPHAHSLCSSLRLVAEAPDGATRPLITIQHFDENWHDSYRFVEPVRLAKGTRLVSTFTYDNTDGNIRNRNHPARRVVYGSSVTDEMADVYLQLTPVRADQREAMMEQYKQYELRSQIVGYTRALEAYPDDPWSLEGLAAAHVGLGAASEAIPILERRLETGPRAVFPVVSLGLARLATGDAAGAEGLFRRAISMDENYPLAWFGLGQVCVAKKDVAEGEAAYRRAVDLAPALLGARLGLADLLMRLGRLDEGAMVCSSVLGDSPDMAGIYMKLAEIRVKQRRYDEALAACASARAIAPYTHPAKLLVALDCFADGDQEHGMKFLLESQAESPRYPMPSLVLGQLAARGQRWVEAKTQFEAAASLPVPDCWPESHRRRFLVLLHSQRARVADQLQDLEMARDALTKWADCDPGNAQVRRMLESLPPAGAR